MIFSDARVPVFSESSCGLEACVDTYLNSVADDLNTVQSPYPDAEGAQKGL